MYKILTTSGVEIGFTDELRYIKISPEGSYIEATAEEAIGIAFRGTPYNLNGHTEITGAEQVNVVEVSMADVLREQRANMDYLAMMSGIDFEAPAETEIESVEVKE